MGIEIISATETITIALAAGVSTLTGAKNWITCKFRNKKINTTVNTIKNQVTDKHLKKLIKENINDCFDEHSEKIIDKITLNLSELIIGKY